MIFLRSQYATLWLELESNEILGVLDTDYIEDYSGLDGFVSLLHIATGQRWSVPMTRDTNRFSGGIGLSVLPDGQYAIQGRVRDVAGNYSILGAIANPNGFEAVQVLSLEIQAGNPPTTTGPGLRAAYGFAGPTMSVGVTNVPMTSAISSVPMKGAW